MQVMAEIKGPEEIRFELSLSFYRGDKAVTDVDEIVSDHAEADKAPHSIGSLIAAAMDAMSAFQNADTTFTAGAPFHGFPEPPLFLTLPALLTFGGLAGNRYPLDAHLFSLGFIGG